MKMKNCFDKIFTKAKRAAVAALVAVGVGGVPTVEAETAVKTTFTVCPLNVDGLPTAILGIQINPDGKGADGATAIGNYLKAKGIDVLAFSEDFNYHSNLIAPLSDDYTIGTYRGGLSQDNYQSVRFNTDGLEFLTKKATASFRGETWTEWNKSNGLFTNGADELIRKGYRYYTVDLGNGVLVDVYTMHMDAETDAADNETRASQWTQLCTAIQTANTGRPVIVMGDTNSRYTRDDIQGLFITPLSSSYDIKDAWVEKCKNGTYPTLGSDALLVSTLGYTEGEIVDKVIYLNPKDAKLKLTANSITFDNTGYVGSDGSLLGDHVPVIVSFTAEGTVDTQTSAASTDFWCGETWTGNGQQAYLYNVGMNYFISNNFSPTVKDISQAPIWTINGSSSSYTITNTDGYGVRMETTDKSDQGIVTSSNASSFTTCEAGETEGSYRFGKKKSWTVLTNRTRFFGIDNDETVYTAAQTKDKYNEWLLISETQKEAYYNYVKLYNEAKSLLDEREDLNDELKSVLDETAKTNYSTYESAKEKLESIIAKYQKLDVKITAAKFATTCLPWNGNVPEGVTVYIAAKYNDDPVQSTVHLVKYNGTVLPKGVGFLLYSETVGTYTFTQNTTDTPENPATNILSGTYKKIGNGNLNFTDYDYMLLGNKSNGVGFYRLDETSYIPAYRAYLLHLKQDNTSEGKRFMAFVFDTETSVSNIQTDANATVVAIYGLSGERRNTLGLGVNVVKMSDGSVRKVLVK